MAVYKGSGNTNDAASFDCRYVSPNACDVDGNCRINMNDINAILAARNTRISAGDPRDADGDGMITLADARMCTLRCDDA